MFILIITIVALFAFLAWTWCAMAGREDRAMDAMWKVKNAK